MISAMDNEGKTSFLFHCTVAFSVPLLIQLALMDCNPSAVDEVLELTAVEQGHENSLVFVRHVFISAILCLVYYLRLRTHKENFIRVCLHEQNEKSVTKVLDQVSEPIIIVKRKH